MRAMLTCIIRKVKNEIAIRAGFSITGAGPLWPKLERLVYLLVLVTMPAAIHFQEAPLPL